MAEPHPRNKNSNAETRARSLIEFGVAHAGG